MERERVNLKHNFEKGLLPQFNSRLCALEEKADELHW